MGTQGVLTILFRGLVLVAFSEDEKVCSSGSNRSARSFFAQVAAPRQRTFPKFVFYFFANHEDPFSFDWILVSPDDFQFHFFKSSNRAVELSEGVRSNNFCAKLVVCFRGKPQGQFWTFAVLSCKSTL
jgi:hypothetical protein